MPALETHQLIPGTEYVVVFPNGDRNIIVRRRFVGIEHGYRRFLLPSGETRAIITDTLVFNIGDPDIPPAVISGSDSAGAGGAPASGAPTDGGPGVTSYAGGAPAGGAPAGGAPASAPNNNNNAPSTTSKTANASHQKNKRSRSPTRRRRNTRRRNTYRRKSRRNNNGNQHGIFLSHMP